VKLIKTKELRKILKLAMLMASKRHDPRLLELLLDRVFVKQTPETAGLTVQVNNQHQLTENHVRIGEHLADVGTRDALAQLAERLQARGVFAGGNGHGG